MSIGPRIKYGHARHILTLVLYSGHGLNDEYLARCSIHGLNNGSYDGCAFFDHLNTGLV